MKIQRPLFWHQGLFLQPQHFQLQEQSHQARLIPLLRHQHPHFWGMAGMEIDLGAVSTGTFKLHYAEILFEDGAYLQLPGNALCQARSFESHIQEGKPLQVLLGVKRWNDSGENVTVIDSVEQLGSVTTRFAALSDPEEVADLHGKGPDGQVKQLHYVLRLFFETEVEQAGDYLLVPLARLENFSGMTVSKSFIPPALTLDACDSLTRLVREIRDLLAARIRQLEQYKKQRGVQNAAFGSRDMVYLLALRTLNRYAPLLFHQTEAPAVHPWDVYGALRQLVGELSTFSVRVNFLGEAEGGCRMLPPYDHKGLWEIFSAAQQLITRLLDDLTAGPDYIVRLENDGTYFSAELKPSLMEGGSRYFLALKTEEDPHVVHKSLASVAKLSARDHLPVLTSHALPGLNLEYLHAPPQELPRRPNTHYFAVDHCHDQWELVTKGNSIALNWDKAPPDLEVELMVVEKIQQ